MAEKNSLWKNIRANKGSGRKPTTEMLRQERKIRAKKAEGGPVGDDELYNIKRAVELGYTPDETGHWPSVDSETGMWLKSKEHPTAWMEYLYGHTLNPELNRTTNVVVNPEGYFGNNQLQYIPKKQYAKGGLAVDDEEDNRPVRHVKSADDPAYRNYVIQKRLAEFSNLPHSHQTHLMQQDNFKNALNDNNLVSLSDSAWNNFLNPTLDPNSSVFNNPVFTDPTTGLYGSEVFYEDASSRPTSSNTTGYNYIDYPYANPTNLNARWTNSSDPTLSYDVPAFLQNHPPNRYHNKTDYTNLLASDFKRSNPGQFTVPDTQPIENNTNLADLQRTYPNLTQAELDAVVLNEQTNPGYITNRRDSSGRFIWDWSSNYPANRQNDINYLARRGSYYPESFSNGVNTNMYTMPEWDEPSEYVVIDPQIDELKRREITNIPIQEDPVKMQEVKWPRFKPYERKTVMFNQSNNPTWGVNPDDPGKEYNLGDGKGWRPYPQGEYIDIFHSGNEVIEHKYPSYLDYLKQNSDEYDIQGEYANGGYMYPGGGYTGPVGPTGPGGLSYIPPTRQDSLDVFNNALAVRAHYDAMVKRNLYNKPDIITKVGTGNELYNKYKKGSENNKKLKKSIKDITDNSDYIPQYKTHHNISKSKVVDLIKEANKNANYDDPYKVKIYDFYPSKVDISAPATIIDSRISPQGEIKYVANDDIYNKGLMNDLPGGTMTGIPMYDPLAVAPFDILPPEQQKERLDKYGPEGIPQSYIDSRNKISTTADVPIEQVVTEEPQVNTEPFKPSRVILREMGNVQRYNDGQPHNNTHGVYMDDKKGWRPISNEEYETYKKQYPGSDKSEGWTSRGKHATGGYVNKYDTGGFVGEDDDKTKIPKTAMTYNDNRWFYDSHAVIPGRYTENNPQYNKLVKRLVYEGKVAYDPTTGVMHRLKEKIDIPEGRAEMATEAYARKPIDERLRTNKAARKSLAMSQMIEMGNSPGFYAPGAIAGAVLAGPAVLAGLSTAMSAPLSVGATTIPWLTAGDVVGAGFAVHGAEKLSDDINSNYYTSDAPIGDKIARGIGTGLDFASMPGVISAVGKGITSDLKTLKTLRDAIRESKSKNAGELANDYRGIDIASPINGHSPGTPEWDRLNNIIIQGRQNTAEYNRLNNIQPADDIDYFPWGQSNNELAPPPSEIHFNPDGTTRTVYNQQPITDYIPRPASDYVNIQPSLTQGSLWPLPTRATINSNYYDITLLEEDYVRMVNGYSPTHYPNLATREANAAQQSTLRNINASSARPRDINSSYNSASGVTNRSGLTKENVLAKNTTKDKETITKMTDDEFSKTVLKPNGEIVEYRSGFDIPELGYNPNATQLVDAIPMHIDDYVSVFNDNIHILNDIIKKNNHTGIDYEVVGIDKYGQIRFRTPKQIVNGKEIGGDVTWSTNINPGEWRGEVQDIANAEYYKGIPGIDMTGSSNSVFADYIPRERSGAYKSINEYLKRFDLGRVKPGFNSQSETVYDSAGKPFMPGSKEVWEHYINAGEAFGYYHNPRTLYGALKTMVPFIGTGAVGVGASNFYNNKQQQATGGYSNPYQQYAAGGPYDDSLYENELLDKGDKTRNAILKGPLNEGAAPLQAGQDWVRRWTSSPNWPQRLANTLTDTSSSTDIEHLLHGKRDDILQHRKEVALDRYTKGATKIPEQITNAKIIYSSNPANNDLMMQQMLDTFTNEELKKYNKDYDKDPKRQGVTVYPGDSGGIMHVTNYAGQPGQARPDEVLAHEFGHYLDMPSGTDAMGNTQYEFLDDLYAKKFKTPARENWLLKDGVPEMPNKKEFLPYLWGMRERHGLEEDHTVTEEELQQMRKSGDNNPLFKHYPNNEDLLFYLNEFGEVAPRPQQQQFQQQAQPQVPYQQHAARGGYYAKGGKTDNDKNTLLNSVISKYIGSDITDDAGGKGYDYWTLKLQNEDNLNEQEAQYVFNAISNPMGNRTPLYNSIPFREEDYDSPPDASEFDLYTGSQDRANIRRYRPNQNLEARKPFGYGELEYAQGGYTNPYNQYQKDPYLNYAGGGYMYAGGGRGWKKFGNTMADIGLGIGDVALGSIGSVTGIKSLQDTIGTDQYHNDDFDTGANFVGKLAGTALKYIPVTAPFAAAAGVVGGVANAAIGIDRKNYDPSKHQTGLDKAGDIVNFAGDVGTMFVDPSKAANTGAAAAKAGKTTASAATTANTVGKIGQAASTTADVVDTAVKVGEVANTANQIGQAASTTADAVNAASNIADTAQAAQVASNIGEVAAAAKPVVDSANKLSSGYKYGEGYYDAVRAAGKVSKYGNIAQTALSVGQPIMQQKQQQQQKQVAQSTMGNEPMYPKPDANTAYAGITTPTFNTGTPVIGDNINTSNQFFSQGGNITNNSLNLRNTMRYKRFAQGGTFDQYGINMIPDSAGLHHESAYGGVPIGPDALAEGGEIKMDTGDGGQYIVSDQVDGAESQKDFMFSKGGKYKELNRTLADGMKQDLNKYTFGSLATSDRVKGDLRRPFDSYGESTVEQIKQKWQQKTEYARQRSQQEQAIAQAEEQKRMAEEQYVAAYGGRINPKKYPGLNMTKKAKGGYVYNPMTQPMLATGGPVYGDPASPYTYARGGQINYTNDMYAGGGPMPSNLPQGFRGPSAQNRGGMYAYPDGGMMPPEQQMMQEQMMQQQAPQEQMQQQGGGEEQMMQMVQQVAQAIASGAPPEQVMQQLVQSGVPPEQAQQIIQAAMQMAQQMQQQQQPMQGQGQMMPPQGMANGGMMQQQSGAATKIAEALQQGAQPQEILQQLIDSGMPQEQAMAMMQAVMGQLKNQMQQQQPQQQMMAPQQEQMAPQQPMMARGGYFNGRKQFVNGGNDLPKVHLAGDNNPAYFEGVAYDDPNDPSSPSFPVSINMSKYKDYTNGKYTPPKQDGWRPQSDIIGSASTEGNKMFPESWQSIAAGTAQALPGIAGAAFAFGKLKDRKLTPTLASSVNIDYSPERVALREEGRRGIGMALDTMKRNAPTSGSYMNNAREAVLRGNKVIGGQISKSWQDQKNEQAKYDFETNKTNTDIKNKTNEINESMYQNAMEQGFKSSQDAISKVSNYYTGKEGRDIQRWQAQNTSTKDTRWLMLPDGSTVQVHRNANGEFWHDGKKVG